MTRRGACALLIGALVAAACSTPDTDEAAAPAPAPWIAAPTTGGSADGSEPGGSAGSSREPGSAQAEPPPEVVGGEGAAAAEGAVAADDPAPASTLLTPVLVEVVFPDDEPTFDAEPLQPLDFDAARFPVDDAGIGGEDPPEDGPLPTGWAGFDAALEGALLRNGNTAVSVAVSIGGDIVHAAAFGQRARDADDRAEPVDRFRIASISKTITAITVLQLVEEGVVGLDDPVGRIVADHLGMTNVAAGVESITVRQLLNHTAGFGKYQGVFFRAQSTDCRDAAAIGLRQSLSASPGSWYRYSNMNYCVAGVLVEALTGQPYEVVVYEQLLTPLGLSGLRLAPTFDPGPDEILHPTNLGRNYMETLAAAGGWLASPSDLVTILDSLDPTTPGWKPLELDTLLEMQIPVGGEFGQRGYGLGLLLYGPGRYGHTGTIESTHAMVMNRGDGVIWAITVSGPYPSETPRLESIINAAFLAGGFVAG